MSTDHNTNRSILPEKVNVTLRAGGAFFAAANVVCVAILAWTFLSVKLEPKTLSVTGSARKAILSDLVTWSGVITAKDTNLVSAYDTLKTAADKSAAFLSANGVPESDITVSAITTGRRFHQDIIPGTPPTAGLAATPPTFITTDKVEMYTLTQTITVSSTNIAKVEAASRAVTSLIKEAVEIESAVPSYLYTKLSELKINMLAEATKDATARASQIVNNANGRLGKLVEARMGVMQINPKGVTATTAEGINDTTSLEKEITAIVSVRFEVK